MILLDTSGLLAAVDESQRQHESTLAALSTAGGPLVLSPFVLAELDYLLATRVGQAQELSLLGAVAGGAFRLETFARLDVTRAKALIERYADLSIGLADASIVVLSERYDAFEVLTLDERHFRVLRGRSGRSFRLLPADA